MTAYNVETLDTQKTGSVQRIHDVYQDLRGPIQIAYECDTLGLDLEIGETAKVMIWEYTDIKKLYRVSLRAYTRTL